MSPEQEVVGSSPAVRTIPVQPARTSKRSLPCARRGRHELLTFLTRPHLRSGRDHGQGASDQVFLPPPVPAGHSGEQPAGGRHNRRPRPAAAIRAVNAMLWIDAHVRSADSERIVGPAPQAVFAELQTGQSGPWQRITFMQPFQAQPALAKGSHDHAQRMDPFVGRAIFAVSAGPPYSRAVTDAGASAPVILRRLRIFTISWPASSILCRPVSGILPKRQNLLTFEEHIRPKCHIVL
jgi:hypothetical protein